MTIDLLIPMLAQFQKTDLVLAAGITLVISGLVWNYKKRSQRQSTTPSLTPMEQLERNHQMRGVRGDLEVLMVEIEQFSKRLSSHLDAKTAAMEMLLKRVDRRIAELKQLTENNGNSNSDKRSTATADPYAIDDEPQNKPGGDGSSTNRASEQLPEDPLSRSVYQLADQGLDAYTIAQRLKEHVGKIELILALRTA